MSLALMLLSSCEVPRTQLLVGVDTDLPWGPGGRIQSVSLEIRRGSATGPLRDQRVTALGSDNGRQALPLWVTVLSADDHDTSPLWIEALGCATADGCTRDTAVVKQRASVTFVPGQSGIVRLLLAGVCATRSCALTERCATSTGTCVPIDAQSELRAFGGVLPGRWASDAAVSAVDARDASRGSDVAADLPADVAVDSVGPQVCAPGVARCVAVGSPGRAVCAADGRSSVSSPCGLDEVCDVGACVARVCDPGAFACADASTRRRCTADGLAWLDAPCRGNAAYGYACLGAGVCTQRLCFPGTSGATCASDTAQQVCSADGQQLSPVSCSSGFVCGGGACPFTCFAGQLHCGSACTSVVADPANCGACGHASATGETCTGGACQPPATACALAEGDRCVDGAAAPACCASARVCADGGFGIPVCCAAPAGPCASNAGCCGGRRCVGGVCT